MIDAEKCRTCNRPLDVEKCPNCGEDRELESEFIRPCDGGYRPAAIGGPEGVEPPTGGSSAKSAPPAEVSQVPCRFAVLESDGTIRDYAVEVDIETGRAIPAVRPSSAESPS